MRKTIKEKLQESKEEVNKKKEERKKKKEESKEVGWCISLLSTLCCLHKSRPNSRYKIS